MRAVMLTCLLVVGCRAENKERTSSSPSVPSEAERVVQHGLDAWNKHDVEGALSVFSPDVKLYLFPDKEVVNPLDSLRARWRQRFAKDQNVHVTVSPRIVHNNFVIDHENVTGLADGGTRTADWIYQIDGGRIVRAWRLPD
jgi:hypothetical protein